MSPQTPQIKSMLILEVARYAGKSDKKITWDSWFPTGNNTRISEENLSLPQYRSGEHRGTFRNQSLLDLLALQGRKHLDSCGLQTCHHHSKKNHDYCIQRVSRLASSIHSLSLWLESTTVLQSSWRN